MGLWVTLEVRGRVLGLAGAGECDHRLCDVPQVAHGLQAYDGLSLPEDAETVAAGRAGWSYSDLSDDEDLLADEASGGEQRALVAGSGRVKGWRQGSSRWSLERPQEAGPRGRLRRRCHPKPSPRSSAYNLCDAGLVAAPHSPG